MSSLLAVSKRSAATPMEIEDYLAREHSARRRGPIRRRPPAVGGALEESRYSLCARRRCSSPRRIVTRSESRCSSRACANFREVLSASRNWASVNPPS
jgi:hypothetical protein